MRRLTILMLEVEQPEGLTSRKLIAETMKHNVLTAYSLEEGMALLRENKVHLILVHSLLDGGADAAIRQIRTIVRDVPILQIIPDLANIHEQPARSPLADEAMQANELDRFYNYLDDLALRLLGKTPARYPETRIA